MNAVYSSDHCGDRTHFTEMIRRDGENRVTTMNDCTDGRKFRLSSSACLKDIPRVGVISTSTQTSTVSTPWECAFACITSQMTHFGLHNGKQVRMFPPCA